MANEDKDANQQQKPKPNQADDPNRLPPQKPALVKKSFDKELEKREKDSSKDSD